METNYPGNSSTPRPSSDDEKPADDAAHKVEKIVEGRVVRRKKPLGKRFTETFIGGNAKAVLGYILFEVLVPAAKDTIADVVTQGIERTLYGDGPRSTTRRGGGGYRPGRAESYVAYNRYATPGSSQGSRTRERDEPRMSQRGRAAHDFDEIILDSIGEANEVIEQLFELVSKFERARVADLYDMVGIDSAHTDYTWGWTDLRGARASRVSGGYLLNLPKPEPLGR